MKTERDYIASDEVNRQELDWWNEHSDINATVWRMRDDISHQVRRRYLARAREFFSGKGAEVRVLELGCGAGWVGQSIAGPGLRIIGTDFSKSQIRIAKDGAREKRLDEYCEYFEAERVEIKDWADKIDGVLIHAFLHHLDGRELEGLLDDLKTKLKSGTRIWIYEPTFYKKQLSDKMALSMAARIFILATSKIFSLLHALTGKFDLIDRSVSRPFMKLVEEAAEKGWYLTPKEIPFDLDSFTDQLGKNFNVTKRYWATIYLVGWVFEINLIKNAFIRNIISKTLVPLFCLTDHMLTQEKKFLENKMVAPNYAFHVWECIVP